VICEILKDDGTMARLPDLVPFAQEHGLKIGAIADLIHYRNQTESLVERAADRLIQTVVRRVPPDRLPRQVRRRNPPRAGQGRNPRGPGNLVRVHERSRA
jgi:hypothetical protein